MESQPVYKPIVQGSTERFKSLNHRRTPSRKLQIKPNHEQESRTIPFPILFEKRRKSTIKNRLIDMSMDINLFNDIPKKRLQPITCNSQTIGAQYFHNLINRHVRKTQDSFQYNSGSRQNKRTYNEDRVVCVPRLEIPFRVDASDRRLSITNQRSYFAVFDGHGGSSCADFLKDNLHHYVPLILRQISHEKKLLQSPELALKKSFEKIERRFTEIATMGSKLDQSGACAIVCLLLDETVYLANVGDSHAVMAKKDCDIPEDMNIDHKPSDKIEYKRIVANGGKLIRENNKRGTQSAIFVSLNQPKACRIHPGNLNVSRTIGDVQAKLKRYGGLPNVISSEPDIYSFPIADIDYIVIGSDGIFEGLTKFDIHRIYKSTKKNFCEIDRKEFAQEFIKQILNQAMKLTSDNISVIVIFPNK